MKKIIFSVLILAAILRLWGIGNNPPHLTSDEAALGYNAYSILQTGRDEHGELFPVIFKSFGDWKPGLYIYLSVPFIAIFGLNEFSTRIVGALSGVLAVYLLYLVSKELINNFSHKKSHLIPVLSAFFLAISPWHIQFTRGAWEAGLNITLLLAGILFFIKSFTSKGKDIYVSAIFFSLTFWAYQGAKLSTTILLIVLLATFYKEVIKIGKKKIFFALLLGFAISIPVFISIFQGKAGRLEVFSVFSYPRSEEYISDFISQREGSKETFEYYLYHSEGLSFVRGVLGRWMSHFSGRFLFITGDWSNFRHSVPNMGEMLLIDLILLALGVFSLVKKGMNKMTIFIFSWMILAPLPAALSRDSIHAVRSFNLVIPQVLVLASGASFIYEATKNKKYLLKIVLLIFCFGYLLNYFYYLDQYWIHSPLKNSKDWQYGYKEVVENVEKIKNQYPEIIVKQSYSQPYIFFLFFEKYSPQKFQLESKDVFKENAYGDVGLVNKIDNITFRDINWGLDSQIKGKVFVVDAIDVPDQSHSDVNKFKILDRIYYLNNTPAFKIIEIL